MHPAAIEALGKLSEKANAGLGLHALKMIVKIAHEDVKVIDTDRKQVMNYLLGIASRVKCAVPH